MEASIGTVFPDDCVFLQLTHGVSNGYPDYLEQTYGRS